MRRKMTYDYWESIVEQYHRENKISCDDFHYGPLICGDGSLKLLPRPLRNLRCLEIACGGAQNSIYLAKHGAECTAVDASRAQISYAGKLARKNNVKIDLQVMSMEEMSLQAGNFDLIHSSYGFNFATDFNDIIRISSGLLDKNAVLLFSMPHPLFSGEFLKLDGEAGLFLSRYFGIPPDLRFDNDGRQTAQSRFYSLDDISVVLAQNGLLIERICEARVCEKPPYTSKIWEEYRQQILHFPGTIIIKAILK